MARYIDADRLQFEADRFFRNEDVFLYDLTSLIFMMPTADVVEVVRCKDCDVPHNKWTGCPNLNGLIPPPDFYCAKGTPKERGREKALKEREKE